MTGGSGAGSPADKVSAADVLHKRLIIVGGKGGVGRSTVAAALACALAEAGRRTLLAAVRCEGRGQQLARLLGVAELGDEITAVRPQLWAVNMNPQAAIREMGMMVLRFRAVYRAVLENRIIRSFLRAVPALDDYSMIGKAWFHTTERDEAGMFRFDTVVFDGPATGHLISMLRIPQVILDSVPDGPLTADARQARRLLSDAAETALLIVTLAEEMPAAEARDLYRAARNELDIGVAGVVVNGLYPARWSNDTKLSALLAELGTHQLPPDLEAAVGAASMIAERRKIHERYLGQLARELPVKQLRLPHLFNPDPDYEALEPLRRAIATGFALAAGG